MEQYWGAEPTLPGCDAAHPIECCALATNSLAEALGADSAAAAVSSTFGGDQPRPGPVGNQRCGRTSQSANSVRPSSRGKGSHYGSGCRRARSTVWDTQPSAG